MHQEQMSILGANPDGPTLFRFLPVLDGRPAEELVELDGLVGGDAGLVLRGLRPQPEVDVLLKPAPLRLLALRTIFTLIIQN